MVAHPNPRQEEVEPADERVETEVPPRDRLVVVEQGRVGVGEPVAQRVGVGRGKPAEAERGELAGHREVADGDRALGEQRLTAHFDESLAVVEERAALALARMMRRRDR